MRRIVMLSMVMGGWLALVGCGGSDEPSVEVEGPTIDAPAEPEEVSPLELLPDEKSAPEVVVEIDPPADNAAHRIAGRSAFPEADEAVTALIPFKTLSEVNQFAEPIDPSTIPDIVPWTEAKKYVGYGITVEGKIVDIGQSRDGKVNFLNFDKDWRDKFYMVIFDDLAKSLPNSIEQTFNGKTLRVNGMVEDHRGRPQIKILSMNQVQFVGE